MKLHVSHFTQKGILIKLNTSQVKTHTLLHAPSKACGTIVVRCRREVLRHFASPIRNNLRNWCMEMACIHSLTRCHCCYMRNQRRTTILPLLLPVADRLDCGSLVHSHPASPMEGAIPLTLSLTSAFNTCRFYKTTHPMYISSFVTETK